MSTLSLRLPDPLHEMARQIARQEHVSINHLISTAVAEKISALATKTYLRERAAKGSRKDFEDIMSRVPNVRHSREPMKAEHPTSGSRRRGRPCAWSQAFCLARKRTLHRAAGHGRMMYDVLRVRAAQRNHRC
jgi:hypothetical protein